MKIRSVVAPLLIVAVVACAPAGSRPSPELAALADGWERGLNEGDAEAIAELYAEDARLMPPNAEMGRGRDAARADFGPMIEGGLKGQLETIEAVVSSDIGYRVGTYVLTAPDGSLVDRGKYIETWRNVDGSWQISNDIWNSDLSPGGPDTTTLVITHEVEDPDRWLDAWQGDNSRHQMFAEHGVAKTRTFQNPDRPNMTAVVVDVADMDAFDAFMASPEVASAKNEDGVKDSTLRVYTQAN